jgi:hypothetical protein
MAINITNTNSPTIYKVIRPNNEPLDLGWEYKWYVTSTLNPAEVGFYTIAGVVPNTWTNQSCVTITFLRPTSSAPLERFQVFAVVKIIRDDEEICETVCVADVIVQTDTSEIIANGTLSIIPATNCVFLDKKYIYSCSFNAPVDYVYFNVFNGKTYDLTGIQYHVTSDPIRIAVDPNDYSAEIQVSWGPADPTNAYIQQIDGNQEIINVGAEYVITAFGSYQGKFTKMIIRREMAMPQVPEFEILGPTELEYDSTNDFTIRVNRLSLYPNDYYLRVQYRKKYDSGDFSSWYYIQSPILLSQIASLVNNNATMIPYFYDFTYTEVLSTYNFGDPEAIGYEFMIELFDSYVEQSYEYDYDFYHNEPTDCYRETTKEYSVDLIHCAVKEDLPISTVSYEIIKCPTTVDLVFGVVEVVEVLCVETLWVIVDPVCYVYCYDTYWIFPNVCYNWCYDTYWVFPNVCYNWTYCENTWWIWGHPCYQTTYTITHGWVGTYPQATIPKISIEASSNKSTFGGLSTHGV